MKHYIAGIALFISSVAISLPTSGQAAQNSVSIDSIQSKQLMSAKKGAEEVEIVERRVVLQSFEGQGTIKFRDSHHGFKLELPDSWELEEGFSDEHLDFVVVGVSPEEGPSDGFVENMNVLVEEIGDKISLNQYFMWNLIGLMQELPNFQVHEKMNVAVNGVRMSRIVYSWDLDSKRTATYQYIFVKGDKGYVLTFSAEPKKFPALRKTFDAVAKSFQFEGSPQ